MSIDSLTRRSFLKTMVAGAAAPMILTPKRAIAAPKAGFNLEAEVNNVMMDPRVPDISQPQWQRSEYDTIVDAARKRLIHWYGDDPHDTGLCPSGALPTGVDVIDAPEGNVLGKNQLRIRYVSSARPDSLTPRVWGQDEDIIYVTGWSHLVGDLQILPGTVVLTASFQDDARGGAMNPDLINELIATYNEATEHADGPTKLLLEESRYSNKHTTWFVDRTLTAKGEEFRPIIVLGDQGKPFDFREFSFHQGVADYIATFNSTVFLTGVETSLIARSLSTNHLSMGKGGPGDSIASYFGKAHNEAMDTHDALKTYRISHCHFENPWANGLTIAAGKKVYVENNRFQGNLWNALVLHPDYMGSEALVITNNDFLGGGNLDIQNGSPVNIVARSNYWATPDIASRVYDKADNPAVGVVDYSDRLSSPDSDMDGLRDNVETDTDNYVSPTNTGTDPTNPDSDFDGLWDGAEVNQYRTNPNWIDTDGDGFSDYEEIRNGTDPLEFTKIPATGKLGLAATTLALAAVAVKKLYNRREKVEDEPLV